MASRKTPRGAKKAAGKKGAKGEGEAPATPADADDSGQVTLRVEHVIPDNVDLTYSDNFIVQHTAAEFTISFSQIEQPFASTDEEYAKLESVKAKVVARIVIATPRMRELIQALITNWKINEAQSRKRLEALNVQLPPNIKPATITFDDNSE